MPLVFSWEPREAPPRSRCALSRLFTCVIQYGCGMVSFSALLVPSSDCGGHLSSQRRAKRAVYGCRFGVHLKTRRVAGCTASKAFPV